MSKILISHSLALGLLLLFAAHSFPMMYPGYDIWWHLDVIRSVEHFDGQSYGRWHWIWNRALILLGIDNLFSQALIIHRTQFSVSIVSIYSATLLLISSAFKGKLPSPLVSASLSALSVVYWLIMHGTSSRAPYLGADSSATMSWINWYSVSHQIALPFYVLATALMIHAISVKKQDKKTRTLQIALSLLLVIAVGLLHAAEVPYFLFMTGVGVILYTKPKNLIFAATGACLLFFVFGASFSKLSHGESALLNRIWNGEWGMILSTAQQQGDFMIRWLNRAQTSWNLLYTLALLLVIPLISLCIRENEYLDWRVVIWIFASAALPAAIHFKYSAGILAQVTYLTLAWRFSFGSFLFVVPSIYLGHLFLLKDGTQRKIQKVSLAIAGTFIFGATLLLSNSQSVVKKNTQSILASLDMERMHFGLSGTEHEQLSALSKLVEREGTQERPCFDLFTAYYLYYLFNAKNICLPGRILDGPTYQSSNSLENRKNEPATCSCSFAKGSTSDAYRMLTPGWNYLLLK